MKPMLASEAEGVAPTSVDSEWSVDPSMRASPYGASTRAGHPATASSPAWSPEAAGATPPEVSIVLASLNERENLPNLISQIAGLGLASYEVIVVDDGSTDGTREFLDRAGREDHRLRSLLNSSKQTLTVAHLQGILAARGRYVVVMDSDLQHPASAVPRMLERLRRGAELVVGSRYLPDGSVGGRPPLRGVISRSANLIARVTLRETRGLSDPISGFFAFRRSVFRPFDPRYRGYETILFMLVMCRGRPIVEVGYAFQPRPSGESEITQDFGFIRVFLTQLVLALRFRRTLATRMSSRSPPSTTEGRGLTRDGSAPPAIPTVYGR